MTHLPWKGRMRTALLRRGAVAPAESDTWAGARRYHERHARDRRTLAELRESVAEEGILEPLLIGLRERDRFVFVYEGHHRAVVALELGEPSFPFQWFVDPEIKKIRFDPFPFGILED